MLVSLRQLSVVWVSLMPLAFASEASNALPIGPREFCGIYPDAPACAGAVVSCSQCGIL